MALNEGKKKLIIHRHRFFYFLLIMPFCMPELVYFNTYTSMAVQAWKAVCVIFAFVIFIKRLKLYRITDWLVFSFFGLIAVVSLTEGVIPMTSLYMVTVYILFERYTKKDGKGWLITFIHILEILAVLNLLSVIIFPDGMYITYSSAVEDGSYTSNWLMGYKNPMIRYLLPACALSHIYSIVYDSKRKVQAWIFTAVVLITMILVKSGTGAIGIVVFIFFRLIYRKDLRRLVRFWSLFKSFILAGIIDVIFVLLRKQEIFSFIIDVLLNRSSSDLTGRTTIWDAALKVIAKSPIFGYGDAVSDVLQEYIYAEHPHNYILYILMQAGIIGLFLVIAMVIAANRNLKKAVNINIPYAGCMIGALTAFWIMGIAESLTGAIFLYPLFIFCSYIPGKEYILPDGDRGNINDKNPLLKSMDKDKNRGCPDERRRQKKDKWTGEGKNDPENAAWIRESFEEQKYGIKNTDLK